MKFLQWEDGRQIAGYRKMQLLRSHLLRFDVYLIKIPDGSGIPPHVDPVLDGFEHHRLNITLTRPSPAAGEVRCEGPSRNFLFGRAMLFRPDLYTHWVKPVTFIMSTSSMYLLSIGWLKREK